MVYFTTSWDDGNSLDIKLLNLMNKYGIKGTFYIPFKGRHFSLRVHEIIKISMSQEVGAHTLSHIELPGLDDEEILQQVSESKAKLENLTKKKVTAFCYPRGKYDENVAKIVQNAGFEYARTTERFKFELAKNPMLNGVSCQTIMFKADLFKFLKINYFNPIKLKDFSNWYDFAVNLFEHAKKKNGIFHLWGHSWEIENLGLWRDLEKFFDYVSKQKDVKFVTNSELMHLG